ncbi:DUF1353 domain-containing protein, partial [Salmonella enterica]|uniref:DUF1353 domain-containing protein n=1 Tax=Salmonella enterica TaxID=28901 RepID=UPI00067B7DCA
MSCFTSPAIMEMLGHYKWRVYEPFRFYLSEDKNDVIEVPVGFVTDLATVPRDYLYHYPLRNRKESDLIFLDGMKVLGVPKWKRIIMYLAVRIFGWKY